MRKLLPWFMQCPLFWVLLVIVGYYTEQMVVYLLKDQLALAIGMGGYSLAIASLGRNLPVFVDPDYA